MVDKLELEALVRNNQDAPIMALAALLRIGDDIRNSDSNPDLIHEFSQILVQIGVNQPELAAKIPLIDIAEYYAISTDNAKGRSQVLNYEELNVYRNTLLN
ncbi:MAG: hypothetical protein KC435_14320 [Thermomicrobiales bacterium]|nr:hypothetical protein [Thermomicrobiales bacterium]